MTDFLYGVATGFLLCTNITVLISIWIDLRRIK